jgi:hypothetical protein
MENSIKITDFKIIRETAKAILLEIEKKEYWFALSKIKISSDCIEMDQAFFDIATKKEIDSKKVQVFLIPENYTDKVYKLIVPIEKGTYKTEKFVFIPKSQVQELKKDSVIFPKWIWEKSVNEILEKEVEYFNSKYEERITTSDYKITVDVLEV